MGSRNKPFYRIVAADARTSTVGRIKETLGWYDPEKDGVNFKLNLDRIDYWQGNGAQFSGTVHSLVKKARKLPTEEATPVAEPVAVEDPSPPPVQTEPEPAAAPEPEAEES
jgi:small subunit ribosomal protein S16